MTAEIIGELEFDIIFGLKYGIIAPERLATLAIFFEFVETITGPKFVSKQTFILFWISDLFPIFCRFLFFILVEPDLAGINKIKSFDFAENSPFPNQNEAYKGVYA